MSLRVEAEIMIRWITRLGVLCFGLAAPSSVQEEQEQQRYDDENDDYYHPTGDARAVVILGCGVLIGAIFFITILLTDLFETSTISVGLYLLPSALVMAFFAFVGGSLADAFGVRIVLVSSSAVLLGAVIILALVGVGWDPWAIAVIYIPIAAGYGAAVPSLPNTAARYLPPEHLATGIGVFNVFFFFGGPIAIALATVVLERREGATDALIPTYSGSAAIYADTLLVLVAMGIVGLLLALRFAPRKETQIVPTTGEESLPATGKESPPA